MLSACNWRRFLTVPEEPKEKSPGAGLIARRVEMPLGIWNDVLELSKAGGIDHRDVVLQLLDLGLQAAHEDQLKPRLVAIAKEVWEKVDSASFQGATDEQALAFLVDLGLQAWARKHKTKDLGPPPGSVRVRLESVGPRGGLSALADLYLPAGALPAAGDALTWKGQHYEVHQRAWSLAGPTIYLRLKPYGGDR